MEYLGKISEIPALVHKKINCSRKFYEPIYFDFEDEESFNSFYFKSNKIIYNSYDKNNGRCIVEDNEKTKYVIDIERVNFCHSDLTADLFICGFRKLKQ